MPSIFVNPLGEETLQHTTREFIVGLLEQMLNIGVFFKFGSKLYSSEQNITSRAREKCKLVRMWSKDDWIAVSKDDVYDEILHMLVENTQEAVERYKDSIPAVYMDQLFSSTRTPLCPV